MTTFKKITLTSAVAFALFAFNACGDDSSTSGSSDGSNRGGIPDTVETFMELLDYDCGESQKCIATYLVEFNDKAVCDGEDGWVFGTLIEKMDCDFAESSDSHDDEDYSSDSEDEDYSSDSEDDYSSDSKKGHSSSSVKSQSSSSESEVPKSYAEAKVMPSGTYDCIKYKCFSTEFLNKEFLADGKYGEMLDTRDGQVYKTTEICDRNNENCQTWMAQNLNYAPDENHVHSLGDYAWSGCYGGKADSCAKYGRLYTWEVAMDKAGCGHGESCNNSYEGSQGICPAGWHLPSYNEWETLFWNVGGENVAGRMLKSEEGWNYYSESAKGIDYYGFSALPAGRRDDNGDFNSAGDRAPFWSSSEDNIYYTYDMVLYHKYLGAYLYDDSKYDAISVRCIKDN